MVSTKSQTNTPSKAKATESGKPSRDVGEALRQAYDDALGEKVPDDLLALLKQLD